MNGLLLLGGDSRLARRIVATTPTDRQIVRRGTASQESIVVKDYAALPTSAFYDIATVVNCVGTAAGGAAELDHVNHIVAISAARKARAAGVRHFIQISSLSVYGRAQYINRQTAIAPVSNYGLSKASADAELMALASPCFAVTILRAPAIYGPGALGKFGTLARLMCRTGWLPVPRLLSCRSVVHCDNIAAVISELVARPAGGGLEFVADHQPFSLATLASAVMAAGGPPIKLVVSPDAMFAALRMIAPAIHASLYSQSLIDPNDAMTTGMTLPVDLAAGLTAALAANGRLA